MDDWAIVGAWMRRLTYTQVKEEFRRKFHKLAPIRANISFLVNQFPGTGNVADEPLSVQPAVPEQTAEQIFEKPSIGVFK